MDRSLIRLYILFLTNILVFFPGKHLYAQLLQPVYSVPSPEAATLSEFGQIPVSHFTGQPEVSIPIYEIEAGDFKYPIALSYSLPSVKARSRIYNYDRQANVTMVSTGNFPAGAQAFSYSGNHLSSVEYDADGNAVADSLSGIRSAALNVLDRMGTVVHTLRLGQSAPDTVRYLYAADGTKLRETVLRPSGSGAVDTVRTDYVGHLIYRDGELAMILVAGGFVAAADEMLSQFLPRPQGTGIDDLPSVYAFYWKDHLGSVRAVSDIYGNVLQAHTYDPYGNEIVGETVPSAVIPPSQQPSFVPEWDVIGTRMDNPFAFSGKERLDSAGLSLYDFGARNFSVGNAPRWTTMDPLSEKYYPVSPYIYCIGDPIIMNDPTGEEVKVIFNRASNKLYITDLDKFKKGLPIKYVSAKDYQIEGIRNDKGEITYNQVLVIDRVFSGGQIDNAKIVRDANNHLQKAIPNAIYDIVDNDADTRPSHSGWYRLDRQDKKRYNDKDDDMNRTGYRLHLGSLSYGCVTVDNTQSDVDAIWKVVQSIFNATGTTKVPDKRGRQWLNPLSRLTRYGTLEVQGADIIPQKQ